MVLGDSTLRSLTPKCKCTLSRTAKIPNDQITLISRAGPINLTSGSCALLGWPQKYLGHSLSLSLLSLYAQISTCFTFCFDNFGTFSSLMTKPTTTSWSAAQLALINHLVHVHVLLFIDRYNLQDHLKLL